MKKLLAIILAGLMVFSAVGVFAEEGATEGTTTEESTTFDAYLGTDTTVTSYFEDFSNHSGFKSAGASVDNLRLRYADTLPTNSILSDISPFNADESNKYLQFKYEAEKVDDGDNLSAHLYTTGLGVNNMSGDKVHYSFDLKADDMLYNKTVVTHSSHNGTTNTLVKMSSDGNIYFGTSKTGIPYTTNQWYSFDVVADFSDADTLNCYIDGCLVYSGTNPYALASNTGANRLGYLIFWISGPVYGNENLEDAVLNGAVSTVNIDNIGINLLPSDQNPTISPKTRTPIYYNFSSNVGTVLNPDTTSTSGKNVYAYERGVYGKDSNDVSLKMTSNSLYELTSDDVQNTNMTETGYASYRTDSGVLGVGDKVKISFSFANGDINEDYEAADCLFIGIGTRQIARLYRTGNVSVYNKSATQDVFLPGKWYNVSVLGTVNSSLSLDTAIYVNGVKVTDTYPMTVGTTNTETNTLNLGSSLRIGLRMNPVASDEDETKYYFKESSSYIDDIMIETFDATEEVPMYETGITDGDNYTALNGTIALKDSVKDTYTVADFTAANPDESFTVLDNGVPVTDTTATLMGKVVVFNENNWQPIYYYVEPEFEYTLTTPDYATGKYTAIADVINNVDKTVRLVVATYNSENELTNIKISSTYSINAVIKASVDVAETDSKIKVFLLDDIDTIVPYGSAVEVTPAA